MEKYELLHPLGRGAFGVTFKVRSKITGDVFAMKCLPRNHFDEEYVKREIMNHRDLRHPNVIQFKEVVSDDYKLGIVMEYADCGELADQVLFNGPFSEAKARNIFQQLVAGVSYIHFKGIIHGNLEPRNILLTSNGDLKICDFSLSKSSEIHSKTITEVGTPGYEAPEVYSGLPYYTKLADVWTCGMILYSMLTGDSRNRNNDPAGRISALPVSIECKDLLLQMLVVNPAKRITIDNIMRHPWYLMNLPLELTNKEQAFVRNTDVVLPYQNQSEDDIMKIFDNVRRQTQILETEEEGDEISTSVEGENRTEDIMDLKNAKLSKQKGSAEPEIRVSQFGFVKEHAPPTAGMEELSKLWRIRDFLCLILSYPIIVAEQSVPKIWINDVLKYSTDCIKKSHGGSETNIAELKDWRSYSGVGGYPSHGGPISKSFGNRNEDGLLSERPLAYVEGLIPKDIIRDIRNGRSSVFDVGAAETEEQKQQLTDSTTIMEEKQVLKLKELVPVIPESILNLAADLAVEQLIQTFRIQDIHNVRFTTRDEVEKQAVKVKIEAALKEVIIISEQDKGSSVLQDQVIETTIDKKKFHGVIWVDASKYHTDAEVEVAQEIAKQLELHKSHAISMKQKMISNGYLVIVVDGSGEKKLDTGHVDFTQTLERAGRVMVLLTTESGTLENDESRMKIDLEIRTKDHLLPWVLFCRTAGCELISSSSAIHDIAAQIVEECRGHLLAIVLVGKSLKNKTDVQLWKLALDKLRTPPCLNDRGTVSNPVMVNAFMNIIWEDLNSIQKQCLECCSFDLENKFKVPVLISIWVGNGIVHTPEEAVHILQEFLDYSILLKLEQEGQLRFPKETKDILQSLLRFTQTTDIKQGGLGLTKMPYTWHWKTAKRIELMDNKRSQLPPSPHCPELKILLLQGNTDLMEIPPSFFDLMPKLSILDLSYTSISDLPDSLFYLEGLKELYLRGCELLMELPPEIKQLKTLEKLDLDETQITHLPREIQELTNLQSLTLCFYGYDQSICPLIPHGVISKLTQLSYLSIDVNPDDKRWDENVQAILQEIASLRGLKTLVLYIPRIELLKYIPDAEHFDFRLVVGDHKKRIISREPPAVSAKFKESERRLRFVYGLGVPGEINVILSRTEAFFLDRHMSIKSLSEFEVENVARLSACIVAECNEMEILVDGDFLNRNLLFYVEFLSVYYMKNLESIWRGPSPSPFSFRRLKYLALQTCPKLTTIFTLDFLDNLSMLEELIVDDCPRLSTLISHESTKIKEKHFLPKLRKLYLVFLPELVSISNGLLIGESLEEMGFYYCPKLRVLSQKELSSEGLKVIKGQTEWWEELIWNEAEWGQTGRPNKFNGIFSPIKKEADVMSQLMAEMA